MQRGDHRHRQRLPHPGGHQVAVGRQALDRRHRAGIDATVAARKRGELEALEIRALVTLSGRLDKELTQRELSRLAGVPQSHISRIENGAVDLRLLSLVEIARVLDLEVALVPRKSVSAVRSIIRGSRQAQLANEPRPAYSLEERPGDDPDG